LGGGFKKGLSGAAAKTIMSSDPAPANPYISIGFIGGFILPLLHRGDKNPPVEWGKERKRASSKCKLRDRQGPNPEGDDLNRSGFPFDD
jgi:hypothetical protein